MMMIFPIPSQQNDVSRRVLFIGPWSPPMERSPPVIGNESVSKIIINDTVNLSSLVILNHNSFRVLFDKIASV